MLSKKQALFIEYYLGEARFNATKAALLAGYSPRTARSTGSENLIKPDIAREIKARTSEIAMGADEVLLRLAEHARGSVEDFIDPATGEIDLAKAEARGQLHLIKRYSRTTVGKATTTNIELHDPQAALTTLARHHGLFTDKQDVAHTIEGIGEEHRQHVESLLRQLAGIDASGEPADAAGSTDAGAA